MMAVGIVLSRHGTEGGAAFLKRVVEAAITREGPVTIRIDGVLFSYSYFVNQTSLIDGVKYIPGVVYGGGNAVATAQFVTAARQFNPSTSIEELHSEGKLTFGGPLRHGGLRATNNFERLTRAIRQRLGLPSSLARASSGHSSR